MSDKATRLAAHKVSLPEGYMPDPYAHLGNARDGFHVAQTLRELESLPGATVIDVGSYDGWLDFLLIQKGYRVVGVELIDALADAAERYAERNFYPYHVYRGSFLDTDIRESFDVGLCYETLEHVDFESVPDFVDKLESLCLGKILISLPDQKHEYNTQHLWTPTEKKIQEIWGKKNHLVVEYKEYKGTSIPGNWLIVYSTEGV